MTRDPADDFDHPALEEGLRQRQHVLYRLRSEGESLDGRHDCSEKKELAEAF